MEHLGELLLKPSRGLVVVLLALVLAGRTGELAMAICLTIALQSP